MRPSGELRSESIYAQCFRLLGTFSSLQSSCRFERRRCEAKKHRASFALTGLLGAPLRPAPARCGLCQEQSESFINCTTYATGVQTSGRCARVVLRWVSCSFFVRIALMCLVVGCNRLRAIFKRFYPNAAHWLDSGFTIVP